MKEIDGFQKIMYYVIELPSRGQLDETSTFDR